MKVRKVALSSSSHKYGVAHFAITIQGIAASQKNLYGRIMKQAQIRSCAFRHHHSRDCCISEKFIWEDYEAREASSVPIDGSEEWQRVFLQLERVNPKTGKSTRCAIIAESDQINLEAGEVQKLIYGDNCYGGEPCLVRRDGQSATEDEGHVMTFVHNENTGNSELKIVD